MKVLVILLVLIGFTGTVFAFEPAYTNYFSNPEFQIYSIIEKNYKYDIPYHLSAGVLENMTMDCESTLLLLEIKTENAGNMTIHLPRILIDSKSSMVDEDVFIVLLDGQETTFEETSDSLSRTLTIPFESNVSRVEIIGVNYPEYAGINACNEDHNPPYSYWFPPLKQVQSGISIDEIQCNSNLFLIQKYDGSPACVTESTKTKLIERGWTTQSQSKIEYQVLSKDKVLSKGTGFDLPKDTFTEDELRELEQHEKELRKTLATKDLSYEEREKIVNEINSMQERIHHPFQTGVPYHLVKMIQERYGTLEANYSDLSGNVYFSTVSPNDISHVHQALRIGIHPAHFSISELKYQDHKIREYLGDEMNILYEKSLVIGSNEN